MILNEKYRIVYDDTNVILQRYEVRLKEQGKNIGEEYELTENFYCPSVKAALRSFVNKELKYSKKINEVLERIYKLEEIINNLEVCKKK